MIFSSLREKIAEVISGVDFTSLKKDFYSISAKYRGESISNKKVVDSDSLALSYISTRMLETTHIVYDVLSRLDSIYGLDISSAIDIGTGTGATLHALDTLVENIDITALEIDKSMLKYARIMCEDLHSDIDYRLGSVVGDMRDLPISDLVIESFVLNELSDDMRIKAVDNMCNKMGKYLVLIEPGTPKSYSRLMTLRDYLISKGYHILLPCPHSDKCGLSDDYCNFSVRVSRSKTLKNIKDATLSYSDEKYMYLVFSKDVDNTIDSVVLRHPVYRKSCVDLRLCEKSSSVVNTTVTKSQGKYYKQVKEFRHGDVIKK